MQGATIFKEGKSPFDFRPGMNLSDVMNVFWPRYSDSMYQFIMASHPDRLKMSECFVASRREGSGLDPMTCTTCHDPHLPIEALGADHYRETCLSCHADGEITTVSMSRQVPGCTAPESLRSAQEDDCAACHMPASGSIDIPHVRVTDHYIRVPDRVTPSEIAGLSKFVGLASLIDAQPTHREMAEGYMTYFEEISNVPYFLDSADVRLKMALKDEPLEKVAPSLVRLRYLQRDYDAIVELSRKVERSSIEDAWTLYRMGEAISESGNTETAITYLEAAVRLRPTHLRFLNRLGMAYVSAERLEEARETFDRLLAENPAFGEAYNNRGFARALSGDFVGAEADLKKAIALDPDAYQAIGNLASLYVNTNRPGEALPYARRLLESDPTNQQYVQLWNFLHR